MGEKLIEECTKDSIFEVPGMLQTSFSKLFEFLQKDILCDVVIRTGTKSIKCHRIVLASCSPYFQAMFTSQLSESRQHVITIGDIDEYAMEALIKFAYTAKIELNVSNAQSLLHASSVLQLDALAKVCCDFMISQLDPCNCLGVLQFADQLGQSELVKRVYEYAKFYFRQVIQEREFVILASKHLEEIISSSDLFVNNEIEVYEAVMLWVKKDVEKRKDLLPKLLAKVHLPLLPLTYLNIYVEPDSLIRKNLECRDLLDEALHYQIWQAAPLDSSYLPVSRRTRPRKSYSGAIFCVGGRDRTGDPSASVEFYNSFIDKWIPLSDMSTRRRHVGCISLKGKIYAVGGCDVNSHLSSSEVYDPVTDTWSQLASLNFARRGLALCSMGHSYSPIYAVGGLDDKHFYSTVERYDVNSNTWSLVSPMKLPRGGVAVVGLKGKMYAFGGNSISISVSSCEVYDPHLDKWSLISPMNECRAGAGAVVLDGYIYVIGGFDNNIPLHSVEKYDPDLNKWTYVSPMKFARGGVGAAALCGLIYAIGGHNGSEYLKTVEIYDPLNDSWEIGPEISDCRAGAGVTWCEFSSDFVRKFSINKLKDKET